MYLYVNRAINKMLSNMLTALYNISTFNFKLLLAIKAFNDRNTSSVFFLHGLTRISYLHPYIHLHKHVHMYSHPLKCTHTHIYIYRYICYKRSKINKKNPIRFYLLFIFCKIDARAACISIVEIFCFIFCSIFLYFF